MKLYFYVFAENKLEFSECEVEEKPKSYTLLGEVKGFYGTRILKSEIGLKVEYDWKQIVILQNRDDELAKEYLSKHINGKISMMQEKIKTLQNQLKIIEEWREDNE